MCKGNIHIRSYISSFELPPLLDIQDDGLVMLAKGRHRNPFQPHSHRMNIVALPAVDWVIKIECSAYRS